MGQHPAGQEVSELLLHEIGQRGAVRMTPGRLDDGVEVRRDHAVQHGVLGVSESAQRRLIQQVSGTSWRVAVNA